MPSITCYYPDKTAPSYYRCMLPFLHCYHELSQLGIQLIISNTLEHECDAYLFTRWIDDNLWQNILELKNHGKTIIYQLDEDLFDVPYWHYSDKRMDKKILDLADQIWVATDYLKILLGYPEKTKVLPTLVDLATIDRKKHLKNIEESSYVYSYQKRIRVLWYGTSTQQHDLDLIIDVIDELTKQKRIEFTFCGYLPDRFLRFVRPPKSQQATLLSRAEPFIYYQPTLSVLDFHRFLTSYSPDLVLAPYLNCSFNQSKSNIKYLEASAAGAVFIASKIEPYHNAKAILCEKDKWQNTVVKQINNIDEELAEKAYHDVAKNYSWQYQNGIWIDAFENIN